MSVKKFKFVSPGVSVAEIDKSRLAPEALRRGPVIIGRAERGPSMRPVTVSSFSEFVETFGEPIPGGQGGDVWRDGNYTSTTYAAYAAQAYLRNNAPATFIRLLGSKHEAATDATLATPGWQIPEHVSGSPGGGAYGLFLFASASIGEVVSGTLAAVWYANDADTAVRLSGALAHTNNPLAPNTSSVGALIESDSDSRGFVVEIVENL